MQEKTMQANNSGLNFIGRYIYERHA